MQQRIFRVLVGGTISLGAAFCAAQAATPSSPAAQVVVAGSPQRAESKTALPAASLRWEPLGRSVEQRVIEFIQFGSGPRNVLVIGPLAGNDALGVPLAEQVAAHVTRFPSWLGGLKLTVIRDPNPDGRLRRTAANARGVELDRNFHTRRWRKVSEGDRWLSGREPETEPETRLLADLLTDLKPDRIVLLAASPRQATVGFCGAVDDLARRVAAELRGTQQPIDPAVLPGSLAVFAGHDHEIATLVVRVPPARDVEIAWPFVRRAILAAVSAPFDDVKAAPRAGIPAAANVAGGPGGPAAAGSGENSRSDPRPGVLTYQELVNGTVLVPVIEQRRSTVERSAPSQGQSAAVATSSSTIATPGGESNSPSAMSPASVPMVTPVRLERLPPIERTEPPIRSSHQEPIPYYPDTQGR